MIDSFLKKWMQCYYWKGMTITFYPCLNILDFSVLICRSVLFLSAIHCTRVLFPIKRHGIRKQRPYANAFLLYAAKFFFWSVCHWSNFELSTDDQHWNGCSRQKRGTQCIVNFLFSFHFLHIPTFVNFKLITFQIKHSIFHVSKMVNVATKEVQILAISFQFP